MFGGMLGWTDLLARRRVVILAEAGSGKTEELREQARQQSVLGKFAFYATVQDVGQHGLGKALLPADRRRLDTWQSGTDPGWFFIDSIDEGKLNNVRLERALSEIADGIVGAEGRAHIILSGRHTDWEFVRDARWLKEILPIPLESQAAPAPTLETLIRGVLGHEKLVDPPPAETSLIVVMAPLDIKRVQAYAKEKKVLNSDQLVAAIQVANMWEFALRPLDLNWIVDYWRVNGRLGRFAEMIEASLADRVREHDLARARRDSLDDVRARQGLERIGAALVFGRQTIIAIPDNESPVEDSRIALSISDVLPDWSPEDRQLLLMRPAFDPATFGRVRLHNDNEGVVRAYLTARWLQRLQKANMPQRRLHDLLFSCTYKIELIKPSMLETAAWLSLWDDSVASEVVRRAPFLLLTAGDPASLSAPIRQAVLGSFIEQLRKGMEIPMLDSHSLTRFAQPDIAPMLISIWTAEMTNVEIRRFVLRLIWLGKLNRCIDIVESASFGQDTDFYTMIFAGRALLAIGNIHQQESYASYIKKNCQAIPPAVVWEAVESLFPTLINVEDLLAILNVVPLGDGEGGGFNLEWHGGELVAKLTNVTDLTTLVEGLLDLLGHEPNYPDLDNNSSKFVQFAASLSTAAERLLILSPPNIAPTAAIDAVFRLGDVDLDWPPRHRNDGNSATLQLNITPARRRATFWRAVEHFGNRNSIVDRPSLDIYQLRRLGWPPGLLVDDIDWLLIDAPLRAHASERKLVITVALSLCPTIEEQRKEFVARIADVAAKDGDMLEIFTEKMKPWIKSAKEIELEEKNAEATRVNEERRRQQIQSWIDFISELSTTPTRLYDLAPATREEVDNRIYNLWLLLRQSIRGSSNYAIVSIAPIAEILGQEVTKAFAAGLSATWRIWKPTLRSERPPDEYNYIKNYDCMGITGISIEASSTQGWASKLTMEHAIRAAEYATLEINGYPAWIDSLAEAWPIAVEQVLTKEAISELNNPKPGIHHQTLEDVYRRADSLAHLIAPALLQELQCRIALSHQVLRFLLPILVHGLSESGKGGLYSLAVDRFNQINDPQICALYLGTAYAINARGATDSLTSKLDQLSEFEQTALVELALPQIFGVRWPRVVPQTEKIDLESLKRLVLMSFRTVRIEDDHDRAGRGVYSPDARDNAQEARSAVFKTLVDSPGEAAFETIMKLIGVPNFPIKESRLRALAYERAAKDAEPSAWVAGEAYQVERQFEASPKTAQELQLLVLRRLEDMQHELIHGDFQQGKTLCLLPKEVDVQNWMADRLKQVGRDVYSVVRESHVAEEKEPDLRFIANVSNVSVPTEIKVIESWTLPELEAALINQLCRQYLRAQDARHGVLLLVHQKPRPRGWRLANKKFVKVDGLVRHLREMAANIRRESHTGPQPDIAFIDVTTCFSSTEPSNLLPRRPKKLE